MKTRVLPLGVWLLALPLAAAAASNGGGTNVKLTRLENSVRVEIGGELFTEYVIKGASRPYLYPVLAADGTQLTRDFPQKQTPGEDTDHPWHRSIWFAHSFVNGIDFWNEEGGDLARSPKEKGRIEHAALLETKDGAVGTIRASHRWVAPDRSLICTDEQTLRFHANATGRFIDYEITLRALPDKPLVLGDNKDGTMATRLAQWMTMPHLVDAKDAAGKTMKDANGKNVKRDSGGKGHIVTAKGDRDSAAWGKRAEWCDYHAERNGKTYGIAIFDNPKNIQHPTWWMVREYGLFAANPFGWHDYEPKTTQPRAGEQTIPAGGSLTLRYRLMFHLGDEVEAKVAENYQNYAAGK